ncbi:MAG: DUF1826 domain-containing protein [Pseudomonadota bacterium]
MALAGDLTCTGALVRDIDRADELGTIRASDCAAVLWRRDPKPGFQDWIDTLDPSRLPTARMVLRPEAVVETIQHLCDVSGLGDGPEREWLEADIADLATRFAALMKAPYLRLRMDAVKTNACSKFHVDAMLARLICTYRGSGTQYGVSPDRTEPREVSQAPTGCPMIMRGSLWPVDGSSVFLHRSPPIAGTGETRLVLVLDPIYDLEDAD